MNENAVTSDNVFMYLVQLINDRKANPPQERSYVASLLAAGPITIGEKIVEEAAEVVEASLEEGLAGKEHLVREAADLLFHLLVMLASRDAGLSDVQNELARRFGTSGIAEKESRSQTQSS